MADAIKNRKSRKNPIRARDEITRDAGHILHPRTQSTGIQTESPAKAKFKTIRLRATTHPSLAVHQPISVDT
jgi:hypothetical protein